jgi:hypothetical protein
MGFVNNLRLLTEEASIYVNLFLLAWIFVTTKYILCRQLDPFQDK